MSLSDRRSIIAVLDAFLHTWTNVHACGLHLIRHHASKASQALLAIAPVAHKAAGNRLRPQPAVLAIPLHQQHLLQPQH